MAYSIPDLVFSSVVQNGIIAGEPILKSTAVLNYSKRKVEISVLRSGAWFNGPA